MPITKDQARVSIMRLLEMAAAAGIILWGTSEVLKSKVNDLHEDFREHISIVGHPGMAERMSATEARVQSIEDWQRQRYTDVAARLDRIEAKIDAIR